MAETVPSESLRLRGARSLRVLRALAHASVAMTLQYRLEAFGEAILSLLWLATALVPLWVVFGNHVGVADWTYPQMMLVVAWFTLLKAFLEGAINPSLVAVIAHVRLGTLDFILLKPADAQLLVSFSKVEPSHLVDLASAFGLFAWSFYKLHYLPSPLQVGASLLLLCAGLAVLYSIAILLISIAFVAVRADNLIYLFGSIFDFARWPSTIFRGAIAFVFTFILPIALMTTYPALALLGKLEPSTALLALLGAAVFAFLSRTAWKASLRKYTSASS